MLDTWVTMLVLVSSFNEWQEVKERTGVSEIAINGYIALNVGDNRKVIGVLTVRFFLLVGRI